MEQDGYQRMRYTGFSTQLMKIYQPMHLSWEARKIEVKFFQLGGAARPRAVHQDYPIHLMWILY